MRTFREFDTDVQEDKDFYEALFRDNKVKRWQALRYPDTVKGKTITFVKIFIEWEEPDAPPEH